MKLGKNSWHAKINKFVFGEDYLASVDCLCPYFWGTILALFATPLWLFGHGVSRIIDAVEDTGFKLPKINVPDNTLYSLAQILGYTFIFSIVSFITIAVIKLVITYGILAVLLWIGFFIGAFAVLCGLVYGIYLLKEKYDTWRNKNRRPSLLIEFLRAKKNKHCPLVSWED